MRKLAVLLALIMILAGLLLSGDSKASITDTSVPDNELASIVNQTANPSSATATILKITMTMLTPPLPGE